MKRQTRNTNWNEVAMWVGFTIVGLAVLATITIIQVNSYMTWASQFHG